MRSRTAILLVVASMTAASCSGSEEPSMPTIAPTSAPAPTVAAPTVVATAVLADVREELVQLVMQREGVDRATAEARADELMDQGVDETKINQQMALYTNWMSNYPLHPILGRHWTVEEAECVIVTMVQVEGVGRATALVTASQAGGMEVPDALALVQPVGFCTDLLAMMRADMTALGVPQDPDCLLAGVTEEDVASWFVALFTHGRDGFNAAMGEGLDLTCPSRS
ncbi:MAG: hypothetical protein VYD46_01980 [Actinomycetota bacterium]|nr:hypothetical protein [Actinomycetota bacterium]